MPDSRPDAAALALQPMKQRFARELVAGEALTDAFLVKSKELRLNKNGDPYLSLVLCDRTGEFDAKVWDQVPELQSQFERDDVIKVQGKLVLFRNRPQLQIQRLRKLEAHEFDLADFLPATRADIGALWAELYGWVEAVSHPQLRRLLLALLDDPDIAARLRRAPAAKSLHHAYLGGLLEHICSLSRAARLLLPNYPWLDGDLLLAGIILHDLGKIEELEYERAIVYSTPGQLLGHMILGLELLREKTRALPDFPPALRTLLEHLIISHHGKYEFGSPKLPMFPEALVLHYLDDLDSKLHAMRASLEQSGEAEWSGYNPSLERSLLHWQDWLRKQTAPEAAAAASSSLET